MPVSSDMLNEFQNGVHSFSSIILTILKDGIIMLISKNHLVGGINCMRSLSDNENILLLFLLIPSL
jgi:hypothetical protein